MKKKEIRINAQRCHRRKRAKRATGQVRFERERETDVVRYLAWPADFDRCRQYVSGVSSGDGIPFSSIVVAFKIGRYSVSQKSKLCARNNCIRKMEGDEEP